MYFKRYFIIIMLALSIVLFGCEGTYSYNRGVYAQSNNQGTTSDSNLRDKIIQIVNQAKTLSSYTVNDKRYNIDCSGLILYSYHKLGYDLLSYNKGYKGNGVTILYKMGKYQFSLNNRKGKPGDIIVFDNTYDMNKDSKFNDELTHVAIVLSVDDKGTYTYAHIGSRGWTIAKMNLIKKKVYKEGDYKYNDFLRKKESWHTKTPADYLSGNLFKTFINVIDHLN